MVYKLNIVRRQILSFTVLTPFVKQGKSHSVHQIWWSA